MGETVEVGERFRGVWYRTTEVLPDVVAIEEPHHREEVISYLIRGSRTDLLIDTGMGVRPIRPVVEGLRLSGTKLVAVNTHSHFDHIGGNWEFGQVLAPANDWEVRNIKQGWSNREIGSEAMGGFWEGVPEGFDLGGYSIPGCRWVQPDLEGGATLDLGNRRLVVIETPGHTPGGICLWDKENRVLFTSDLLYDGPLHCFGEEANLISWWQSLVNLKNLINGGTTICPGHNFPTASPNLIDNALACVCRALRRERPDEVVDGRRVYRHPMKERLAVVI